MIVKFEKLLSGKEELMKINRNSPENVTAMTVHTICNYNKDDESIFYDMLQYLFGDFQPISNLMKQSIRDRMMQNNKYDFIGKSYLNGANSSNNYEPIDYSVEVSENAYSRQEEGFIKLFLKSGGADSLRPLMLRKAKDNNYYLWSDYIIGLLADIKEKEQDNLWA